VAVQGAGSQAAAGRGWPGGRGGGGGAAAWSLTWCRASP
jgi:hypothetical protein